MESLNIFQKIIRGIVPCAHVLENEYSLCFHDIAPKAPVHLLLIPKKDYTDVYDFYENASCEEQLAFHKAFTQVIDLFDLRQTGFRMISNQGVDGGQEVPHFHVHILGGTRLPTF